MVMDYSLVDRKEEWLSLMKAILPAMIICMRKLDIDILIFVCFFVSH